MFRSPQINIYSRDLAKAQSFYASLGFKETFVRRRRATRATWNFTLTDSNWESRPLRRRSSITALRLVAKAVGLKSSCGQTTPMRPSSG
jgi:hypothetical protein